MDEKWMDKYENMKNNNEMMVYNEWGRVEGDMA